MDDALPRWWANPARERVAWPARVDPKGLTGPTRGMAQGKGWRRSSYGFFVPASAAETVEQRIAEARPALTRPFAGVTGWAALRWLGAGWFDGTSYADRLLDVDVVTGNFHARSRPGLSISEERLAWAHLGDVGGLRITSPARSVCFLMRYAPDLRTAVRHFDMAAYNDLVTRDEVAAHAARLNGWTGIGLCREALTLCDENAWSPPEVTFRLIWELDAGLQRPLTNVPIFDRSGNLIGTPDLLDPVAGVIGEYDGALHLEGAQRARDVRREALFRRHGFEYVTMLAGDLADQTAVVARILEAYARAVRTRADERSWTITPPPWWTPTLTVASRRALDRAQRARFLAIRRRAA